MTINRIVVFAGAALLSSCAVNQLRTEYAGVVSERADDAIEGARKFLGRVEDGRRDANIDLAAADPACARQYPRIRATPDIGPKAPKIGFLCTIDPADPTGRPLSMAPIDEQLEPTFLELDALAAYSEALARILEDTPDDPAQPLLDALELARAAQEAATALADASGGPIPAGDDPRVRAAANLINFLGELKREADQVKTLRAFIITQPQGVSPLTEALTRQIKSWERARSADAGLRLEVTTLESQIVLQAVPPAAPAARREALIRFYQRQDVARAERSIAPALLALIDSLETADKDMRRVLKENPDLTAGERRRVADLNRRRVIAGLNHVAALARALRGG